MTNGSAFEWLDYSDAERRRMNEIIGLFRDQGILDEIGLGTVRDSFADLLFPGTSTIQTRARYFFFVPRIYLRLEAERVPSAEAAGRARADQIRLVYALESGGERSSGVIGSQARENLIQLPSAIYWNGLAAFGIRTFRGTHDRYHRSLDGYYVRRERAPLSEDAEGAIGATSANWPPRPSLTSSEMAQAGDVPPHVRRGGFSAR